MSNNIEGSKYLFPGSGGSCNLKTIKGDSYQLTNCNYNLNSKKIESFISKDTIFQFDLNQFDYVIKGRDRYKVISSRNMSGLLMELAVGQKIGLYKEINFKVQRGQFNPIMPAQSTNDRYIQSESYYVYSNREYEKIKLKSKDVLKFVSDQEEAVKQFVKKSDLNYNSVDDVVLILNYYNTL